MQCLRVSVLGKTVFNMLKVALVTLALVAVSGCSALRQSDDSHGNSDVTSAPMEKVVPQSSQDDLVIAEPEAPETIWDLIATQSQWSALDSPEIDRERNHFLSQSQLDDVLSVRAERILPFLTQQVLDRGMPVEIALIPVIESMLDPWAVSSQNAAGLWQITPATAAHYKLRRDWWFDERLDLVLGTKFALDYLQQLHDEFDGDWMLAIAAYNSGPGRVRRALHQAREAGLSTDYWSLRLPKETKRYIPRLIAIAQILNERETLKLTFAKISPDSALVPVPTGGQLELARAAELAGLDETSLRRINPGFLRWASAPEGHHALLLPEDRAQSFKTQLAALPAESRVVWSHYEIRPGDSLIKIAKQFDTKVELLREVNNLNGSFIRAGDPLMIPSGGDWSESMRLVKLTGKTRNKPSSHKVRAGESLWTISRKYKVTVDNLLSWNRLSADNYLQPGQKLKLKP